jgi:hypothetical protein
VATGDEDEDNWYTWIDRAGGEAVRFGCIVVEWDQFPALGAVLPRYYESGNNSGWLVSVYRDLRLDKWRTEHPDLHPRRTIRTQYGSRPERRQCALRFGQR